ncbi:tetratricopeptide repeat-containing sensor histidine kinase [Flavobacteriaceae bacterium XHP0103]|uniref:tetratricopeptide repeat-containing sensor histidine kinase n=1 Tax=Marixanthotalea marina TaxID=2844359 RepID=UPI002989C160|nr:tetratricopeptide repeat-containing sensor histidine kinase [Marixanthotalea marina]MBU3821832.1 tetratricopeptide repeat-containing sensor histidine kinase [Marixanthotalea marina]
MRRIITLTFLLLLSISGFSQSSEIDSLSIQLAFQNADTTKVDTSLKLIEKLYNSNEFDKALKYIIESEKLSSTLNYKKGSAEIAYYKSLIYAQKNDYINAINGYARSKDIFNQIHDTLGVAKVNNSIGLIEIKRGNFTKGIQYSLSAIEELEKRNLKKDLSLAYSNLAKAYYNIKDYDKSIEFYLKALQAQEQLNDKKGIDVSNSQLAELYSKKKEYRKSIEYYEKVLANNGSNDSIRGAIYPKLGGEYLQFNDFENATKYLVEGLSLNRKLNNKQGLLTALTNLGSLNLQQFKLGIAEAQLLEAGEIAESINNKSELLKHYKLMKSLDSIRNRFDAAFVWQRKYYELKNELDKKNIPSINTESLDEPDLDLSLNFDQSNSNVTSPSLNETQTKKDFERLQLIFYALLAALVIVFTFLILIYIKRNSSLKYAQELEEKNIKIELQNEAFQEQTKHLESINNVKDKLFSIISHDLKDSLSSINSFIDLLKDGSLSRSEFDNLIPELSENANNASLLLFNLLNWSKSQMQSLKPNPSLFDVQEVFEDKIKLVEQRLENKGIELVDHSLRDFAYADRSMVEIVIQNLLANALKFCNRGDTITISNHISNGSCILSVADTGIGISKQNIEKLFKSNSFTTTGTNNEKGTGLGLSICKELVELNGGKIWVESTVNVGSTFYVQLPKSKPAE